MTWYKSNSKNQLLKVPLPTPSGYTDKFINAGNIQNSGIETTLNLKPLEGEFKWDMALNFASNKSLVVELSEGITEYTIRGWALMTNVKVVVGHEYGDIFTRGFLRNEAGRILVGSDGLPMLTNGQTLLWETIIQTGLEESGTLLVTKDLTSAFLSISGWGVMCFLYRS